MNLIEKKGKLLAVTLSLCACVPVASTVYAYEQKPGWHGEGNDRYYILESNHEEATGLTKIDGDLYYFNGDGEMQFGWQSVSDDTYYFSEDGTGEVEIQGETYSFRDDCELLNGWDEDGTSYYDENGFALTEKWVEDGGFKYYLDKSGKVVTGWQEIDGKKYYFDETGKMATGSVELDGQTLYLDQDGTFNKGWVEKGDNTYYYQEDGQIVRDTKIELEGKTYFFDETGSMLKDTTKDGYQIAADGSATEKKEEVKEEVKEETSNDSAQSNANNSQTTTAPSQNTTTSSQNTSQPSTSTGNTTTQAPVTSSGNSSAVAAAALAQVGVNQDCTMLVTNSLRAIGISFHGWPEEYLSLGTLTSNPVPGDIIVYSGHVAIYIGNGQAVHGGWLGYTTVVSTVTCTNALIGYVHIG